MTTRFAPRNLQGLPTLTEVIEVDAPASSQAAVMPKGEAAGDDAARLEAGAPDGDAQARATQGEPAPIDEEKLTGDVLAELQRHCELMLEYRLREAIEPALARLAGGLVRDLRDELAATLRDVVARAVSQEVARLRGRQT